MSEFKKYHMYRINVIDKNGKKVNKGVSQFIDEYEGSYVFKMGIAGKTIRINKTPYIIIPKELMDRYDITEQPYISNGLCEMPEV